MESLKKIKIDPNSELGREILLTLDDRNVVYEDTFQFIARMKKTATLQDIAAQNVQPQAVIAF